MTLPEILGRADGPEKTAALVAWVQALYEGESSVPVLVGGAAVELLTAGAYTTGDLDFVGQVPEPVAKRLRQAGFEARGRHWIHPRGEVFLEFPSAELDPLEESVDLEVAGQRLVVLAPEAVLVDRLAAWEHWDSSTDGVNAFLVLRAVGDELDWRRLESLAQRREVVGALDRLREFARRLADSDPSQEPLEQWATRGDSS